MSLSKPDSDTKYNKLPPGKKLHVFFFHKYLDKDKHIVSIAGKRLEENGYKCGYPEQDFVAGERILQNIHTCIEESVIIVPLISEQFLHSDYCMSELQIASHYHNLEKSVSLLPLLFDVTPNQIPPMLKPVLCLEIQKDDGLWLHKLLNAVARHIHSLTPEQEVASLKKQYDTMSVEAQIKFRLDFQRKSHAFNPAKILETYGISTQNQTVCQRLVPLNMVVHFAISTGDEIPGVLHRTLYSSICVSVERFQFRKSNTSSQELSKILQYYITDMVTSQSVQFWDSNEKLLDKLDNNNAFENFLKQFERFFNSDQSEININFMYILYAKTSLDLALFISLGDHDQEPIDHQYIFNSRPSKYALLKMFPDYQTEEDIFEYIYFEEKYCVLGN